LWVLTCAELLGDYFADGSFVAMHSVLYKFLELH
jgi:hypothetical protein